MWNLWPLKYYAAITTPWGVYYNPKVKITEALKRHENCHIQQVKRLGTIRFYGDYLIQYTKNLFKYRSHKDAYLNISYEIEARNAENG